MSRERQYLHPQSAQNGYSKLNMVLGIGSFCIQFIIPYDCFILHIFHRIIIQRIIDYCTTQGPSNVISGPFWEIWARSWSHLCGFVDKSSQILKNTALDSGSQGLARKRDVSYVNRNRLSGGKVPLDECCVVKKVHCCGSSVGSWASAR